MVLTLFAISLLFCFGVFTVVYYLKTRFYQEKNKQRYLHLIAQARQLFEHLPQHRGMANAFLQGDMSFKEKLTQTQNEIDQDIMNIDCDGDSRLALRWHDIESRWEEIKFALASMSPGESFQRHTALITELTYLIGDAAEASKVRDSKVYFHDLADVVFNQLFFLMEFVGRARGIGTGVASLGKMSVANRVKLGFLHQRIEQTTALSQQALASILSKNSDLDAQKTWVTEGQSAVFDFAQVMKRELLETKSIQIKSTDYYALGSEAIGKNLRLFDSLLPVIVGVAEESRGRLAFHTRIFCLFAIVMALILAWQWLVVIV